MRFFKMLQRKTMGPVKKPDVCDKMLPRSLPTQHGVFLTVGDREFIIYKPKFIPSPDDDTVYVAGEIISND